MSTAGCVRTEREGAVLVVTIDRPEVRNAVDRATASALDAAFEQLDADDELVAGVLTGAGDTFCAGADLYALTDPERRNRLEEDHGGPMGPTRRRVRKPTIAAVEGHAVAGGLELALWCDLRVVSRSATFGVFCRRWGVPLVDGGTVRLPRVVGLGLALELILTGRAVDADEAQRIGLANRVVPPGTARAAAVELGQQLAAFPRQTMLADLDAARRAFDAPLDEALLAEHRTGAPALLGEGASAVARFQAGAGRGGRADTAEPDRGHLGCAPESPAR